MKAAEGIGAGTVLVGKYRIESILGRGGMGMVYRARHLALGEDIAIKILRRDVSLDDETVVRFMREAQSAVKLKSEHVARIQDVGVCEDGLPFMVMEFLQGADLGQMVDTHGAMSVPVAVDLVLQACDAIVEAHSLGIVHRDVKPSNLFVSFRPDESAIVKVLDFGISKSAGADLALTQTQSMLGTPAYMSPEQMRSARSVDARTDIWSLGTVLYELVEARRPFEADSFSEMCVMVAVDSPTPMALGRDLEPVIGRCLAKNPAERYPHVAELMRELAPFAGNYDAAHHYVRRAYRTLGLGVPAKLESSPNLQRPSATVVPGPTQSAVRSAATAAMPAPAPPPDVMPMSPAQISAKTHQHPKPLVHRNTGRWLSVIALGTLVAVVGTIALVKTGGGGDRSAATSTVGATGADGGGTGVASGTAGGGGGSADSVGRDDGSAATVGGEGSGSAASDRGSAALTVNKPLSIRPPGPKRPRTKPSVARPSIAKHPVATPPPTPVAKPCFGGDPFSAPRPCKR